MPSWICLLVYWRGATAGAGVGVVGCHRINAENNIAHMSKSDGAEKKFVPALSRVMVWVDIQSIRCIIEMVVQRRSSV